jgi:hypothetical protein
MVRLFKVLNSSLEHVMVWYQMETFSDFIKLFGHLEGDLVKGNTYTFKVEQGGTDVTAFGGKKWIYFSEVNALGGTNPILGIFFIISASMTGLLVIVFSVMVAKKKSGGI